MAGRTQADVKKELASEREKLEDAVGSLRAGAGRAARKVPLVAAGAAGLGLAAKLLRKRVSRRPKPETGGRARLPFLRRD